MSSVEPLTQERRRAMTREHLLAAAATVFARQGFHGATIDDVAAAAGFTKGAVYSNFENKEELFFAVLDEHSRQEFERVRVLFDDASDIPDEQRPADYAKRSAELLWGDRDWQLLFLEFALYAARNPKARQRLAERYRMDHELLVPYVEAELVKNGHDPAISAVELTSIMLALFNGIALRHVTDPQTADDESLARAIAFLERALEPRNDHSCA